MTKTFIYYKKYNINYKRKRCQKNDRKNSRDDV